MTSSEPNWRQFEAAVADFIAAIGHGAKVTHDAKIPDSHTGFPRQRDVWIVKQRPALTPFQRETLPCSGLMQNILFLSKSFLAEG